MLSVLVSIHKKRSSVKATKTVSFPCPDLNPGCADPGCQLQVDECVVKIFSMTLLKNGKFNTWHQLARTNVSKVGFFNVDRIIASLKKKGKIPSLNDALAILIKNYTNCS